MEHFIDLAQKQGLAGAEALQFAEKQIEREERRQEREREREEQQKQREEQQKQREEQEKQREENERQRRHEIEIERMRLETDRESQNSRTSGTRPAARRPKLPTFEDGKDDMDNYLSRFERIAEVSQWPREEWAANLSALLTGRALDAYSRLDRQESSDYDRLKTALLTRYGLTGEGYRKRLRDARPEANETAGQFITRLTSYATRWIDLTNTEHSFEALRDLVVQEQFLESCPRALQVYIKEKGVDDLTEMASYAATYTDAHGRSFHSLCRPVTAAVGRSQPERMDRQGSATTLRIDRQDLSTRCSFCEFPHPTEECRRARNWNVEDRRDRLRRRGACYWCLQTGHRAPDCGAGKSRCTGCGGRHHSLLCSSPASAAVNTAAAATTSSEAAAPTEATQSELSEARATVTAASNARQSKILMQTAQVKAIGEAGSRTVRVMLDSGSNQSFVKTTVARQLGCRTLSSEPLRVETFGGGQAMPYLTQKVQLSLKAKNKPDVTIAAYEVPQICAAPPIAMADELKNCQHLTGLELAEPVDGMTDDLGVDVLIRLDHFQDIVDGRMKVGPTGPLAMGSLFGWILAGRVHSVQPNESKRAGPVMSNFIRAEHKEQLESLWNLESIGISPTGASGPSKQEGDDAEAARHFRESCRRLPDGRYENRWPWKDGAGKGLPTNEQHALVRLKACEAALLKNGRLDEYDNAIQDYLEQGHAERAPVVPDGPVHVLPHHAVYKGEKIRVVFDAAAGHPSALNDFIRPGPNLIADLTGILMRFRFNRIGLTADLEKAFLQLSLHPTDRDVTRFLWRSNASDPEPTTFRMTRVVFGVNASPFLLQATIRHHLELFQSSDHEIVDRLVRDIYCDDLITSVSSEEEASQIMERTVQIFSEAKMNMTKWTASFQPRADFQQLGDHSYPERRVLGLSWAPDTDELVIATAQLAQMGSCLPETKRTILKIAAKFYDPLGFLAPLLVRAKLMLKSLWKNGKGWDQAVTDEVQRDWRRWLHELRELGSFTVPRAYGSATGKPYQLHLFCDASKEAYAAVAYVRVEGQQQGVSTALLTSKSRIAPSQEMTIPRLELTSALIAARLLAYLKNQLTAPPQRIVLWTDSMVALSWIHSDPERWGVYVKNRIREIQALTAAESWRHCPGHENPADLPSRGTHANRLKSDLWLHGPPWLAQDESNWPQGHDSSEPEPLECKAEEKKLALAAISHTHHTESQLFDPTRCSTLQQLLKVTAWILRWIHNCQSQTKRSGPLTAGEISGALRYWIRSAQSVFREEKTALQGEKALPSKSRLRCLSPKLEDGILKKGGRLQETLLTEDEKHPIILPSSHPLVHLLAEDTHRRLCHAGTQQVLAAIRDKFWILRGRQVIRSTLRRCPNCAIFRAQQLGQVAAPLPSIRTRPSRPFSHTGVDLGGPLFVRGMVRHEVVKLYFAVFTCAVTRALHLEVVSSQNTEDFIKAYRRFSARRGKPLSILSDNAKNFKGAARTLAVEGVAWRFIVERAPWWGGFWERMVGLTKCALRRTLGRALLGREELETVLCDIESAINARPLTVVSDDPDDLRPLRPADFLHCPVGADSDGGKEDLRGRKRYHQAVAAHLWKRWQQEYLRNLRDFQHTPSGSQANVGDLVLIAGDHCNRLTWKTGVIQQLHLGRDGLARSATLRTTDGDRRRPVQRLYLLEGHGS